jgi:hypothetical protein
MKRILIISVIIVLCYLPCYSDNWLSIEGKYSRVEYLSGNEQIADSLLKLAELGIPRLVKIFELPLQTLQDKKVRIILTGEPDISNGYALADAVVIYERSSDYMLTTTGSKPWYQHVLLHELAHYFTFIKLKRKFNFFGELANLTLPRWFYEGIAQYYTEEWTTFRGDIYLRTAILTGKLTYSALENLDDGRLLYAAAHGFIRYLADQYGDSSLIRLMSSRF